LLEGVGDWLVVGEDGGVLLAYGVMLYSFVDVLLFRVDFI
jgi:hypothetical protein